MLKQCVLYLSLLLLISSCVKIDDSLMSVTKAISSIDPVTGSREINLTSEKKEIAKAEQITKTILRQLQEKKIPYDHKVRGYPEAMAVFKRLQRVVHRQHLPWEVHLIGQKTWNAFTVGGGKIFLFSGLLEGQAGLKNRDELAVVLSHEMAHNTARHLGEKEGKLLISKLVDKALRDSVFEASFSTNQEDEADKFSAIYSALAGYNPEAGVAVWSRLHRLKGSQSKNLRYTHPLNNKRAENIRRYAAVAKRYYRAGRINPNANQLLQCNALFCNRGSIGKSSGTLALLETLANTYTEVERAKNEKIKRQNQWNQQ